MLKLCTSCAWCSRGGKNERWWGKLTCRPRRSGETSTEAPGWIAKVARWMPIFDSGCSPPAAANTAALKATSRCTRAATIVVPGDSPELTNHSSTVFVYIGY